MLHYFSVKIKNHNTVSEKILVYFFIDRYTQSCYYTPDVLLWNYYYNTCWHLDSSIYFLLWFDVFMVLYACGIHQINCNKLIDTLKSNFNCFLQTKLFHSQSVVLYMWNTHYLIIPLQFSGIIIP